MVNQFKFGKDLWDPSHRFETSWILPPFVLFVVRALISLYCFVTLLFIIGWDCTHQEVSGCTAAAANFSYFTSLTYWGIAFYFLVASIHTFTYARTGSALLDRFPRVLQALHSAYYTTIVTLPFLVTIVYWALLFASWFPTELSAWSNISQHAMNSLFALFEILIPRTNPPPFLHALWLIIILALYLGLAYVTHATKGFYTYGFLDPAKQGGKVAAYVFGIAVAILIILAVVKGLIWVRKWLTEKKMGMDGKYTRHGSWRTTDTELGNIDGTHTYGK